MDKYNAKPSDNPDYKISRPDERTKKEQILLLIHQFTFIGSPQIWNGEEFGMWGADDPDCRKPLIWPDIVYEDERAAFDPSKSRPVDIVRQDTSLLTFYRRLCKMRKDNPVLALGDLTFPVADDKKMLLAYVRSDANNEIIVAFNRSDNKQHMEIPLKTDADYDILLSAEKRSLKSVDKMIRINLAPLTAIVMKRR
jgi:glycosidase